MCFHAKAAVIALRAGKFSCVRRMICPKGFRNFRQEDMVALGADVRRVFEIITRDQNRPRNRNGKIQKKGPPITGCNPQNDHAKLQEKNRNGSEDHR